MVALVRLASVLGFGFVFGVLGGLPFFLLFTRKHTGFPRSEEV